MTLLLQLLALVSIILIYTFISDVIMKWIWRVLKVQRNENFFIELFYNVLLFTIIIVSITAIVATKGKTIFILAPILFYFYYISVKSNDLKSQQTKAVRSSFSWIVVALISLLTTIISFYVILKFSIRNDVSFYTKISECLILQGKENLYHYYNNENLVFNGNVPYHYFEMWFGGLCFAIIKSLGISALSNYLIYIFFVFNLFRVIAVIGIFALIIKYVKLNYIHFVIVFLLLIIDVSAFCNWGNDSYVPESNFYERPNFIFYYLFLIPIFHSILIDKKDQLVIWSAFFIMTTITALPAVTGAIFLYLGYEWFKNKQLRKSIIKLLSCFVVFIFCYATFYKVLGVSKEASIVEPLSIAQIITKTLSIWKACVFMFCMLLFKVGIIILLSLVIILKTFSTKENQQFIKIIFYIFFLCFSSIVTFQLIPYLDNMYQFAFVGYCATFLMIMIVIAVNFQRLKGTKFYLSLILFILLTIYGLKRNLFFDHILIAKPNWHESIQTNFLLQNSFSKEYINEIKKFADYFKTSKGASLIDGKDALDEYLGLRQSLTFQLGNYLLAVSNNLHLPLLSDPAALYPDTDKSSKAYLKAYNFNRLTLFYKEYKSDSSFLYNLKQYIIDNKIDYLVLSKSYDASTLMNLKINKAIKDKNTGHQFLIIEH